MAQAAPIRVGSIARATRETGVCDVGELGVCYEVYELGGRPGYSFVFASGRYDGFSPQDVEACLELTGRVAASVEDYQFTNVMRLARDFRAGRFASAFRVPGWPRQQNGTQQRGRG